MLHALGSITALIGIVLLLVGGVSFIVVAFRESILWGLGVLLLPFVSLVFLILNWQRAKNAFFLQLYGFGFLVLGAIVLEALKR